METEVDNYDDRFLFDNSMNDMNLYFDANLIMDFFSLMAILVCLDLFEDYVCYCYC